MRKFVTGYFDPPWPEAGGGKVKLSSPSLDDFVRVQTGLGQYFRGATEHLLFGVRGRLPYRTNLATGKRAQGKTLVLAPRGEHSAKPAIFRRLVETVSPGPYLEGFARGKGAKGWSIWGDQAVGSIERKGR